jgi:hypothetical protein
LLLLRYHELGAEGVKAKCRPVELEVPDILANGLVDACKGVSGPKVRIIVSGGGGGGSGSSVKLLLLLIGKMIVVGVGVVIAMMKLLKMWKRMRKVVVLVVKAPRLAPSKLVIIMLCLLKLTLFLYETTTVITRLAVRAPWVAVAGRRRLLLEQRQARMLCRRTPLVQSKWPLLRGGEAVVF